MLTTAVALAMRFPKSAEFVSKYWKFAVGGVVVAAGVGGFLVWKGNLEDEHERIGFERAEQQYTAAVNAANERESATQGRLDQMVVAFNGLATQREQAINLTVRPIIEGMQNEVANDPRYRECAVSDGMLDQLNAGRAAVDQGIGSSTPR